MDDLAIREQIAAYIADEELDVADLEDRLETAAWDLGDEPARTLAADVLRLLAEFSNGDWTDADLRDRLGALLRNYWFDQAPKTSFAGSQTSVIHASAIGGLNADKCDGGPHPVSRPHDTASNDLQPSSLAVVLAHARARFAA